jgi:hypothetical protein
MTLEQTHISNRSHYSPSKASSTTPWKKMIEVLFLESVTYGAIAHNELGYTTLSVAEPRRGVSVGASSCKARSVTEDNVPSGRARAIVPSVACQPQLCEGRF